MVRVEPRNGRRVLINGYAIAHLGGVAFDSVTRHHDVIEIQSDDESEEDVDVKPATSPKPSADDMPRRQTEKRRRRAFPLELRGADVNGTDLCDALLRLDPAARPSAQAALDHAFLRNAPRDEPPWGQ